MVDPITVTAEVDPEDIAHIINERYDGGEYLVALLCEIDAGHWSVMEEWLLEKGHKISITTKQCTCRKWIWKCSNRCPHCGRTHEPQR